MELVRKLVLLSMEHNFLVRARHVPGVSNEIADALSRFQMQRFWALAPDADQIPCTIPPSLMTVWERKCSPTLLGAFPRTQIKPTAVGKNMLYNSAWWITSWVQRGMSYPPPRGLIYFASYLARMVRHNTIKPYLAAVRNLHITAGYRDPLKSKLLCYQGKQRIRRGLVTPRVLSSIRPVLQSWLRPRDFFMIWAAFNLAFLWCSEFTYNNVRKFRPRFDLSTNYVAFHPTLACPQHMTVQLKSSKTVVYKRGQSITITRTSSTLCTVSAMQEYFLLARLQQGPLFYFQSGRLLTRGVVSHLLRDSSRLAGLRYQSLEGHSFCVGCRCCRLTRLAY